MPPSLVAVLAVLGVLGLAALFWLLVRREARRARTALVDQVSELLERQQLTLGSRIDSTRGELGAHLRDTGRTLADLRERLGQLGEATRQLQHVGQGVTEIQQLLQVPKLRGNLGEVWLEQLLEQVFPAGLYRRQYAFRSGERVDAALFIGDRIVAIDAKFPLEACQRMLASTGVEAASARRQFLASFRQRIDEIARKYIRPEEGTFDFALLYVPAEGVYYEAVVREDAAQEDSMLAYAMRRRVIPVSPHTFYAYLSAVIHGLRGLQVEEWARELQGELSGLEQEFARYWESAAKVGTHLTNAEKQYREGEVHANRIRSHIEQLADPGRGEHEVPPRRMASGE